jgi:hypothetical protein
MASYYKLVFTVLLLVFSFFPGFSQDESEDIPTTPDTVKIGAYLISLHDINFRDKEYTARFWVWMSYNNPLFDFTKQLEVPNAKTIEEPEIIIDSNRKRTLVNMRMKCVMKQSWKVEEYPFDKQTLKIQMENIMFDASSLAFQADTIGSSYEKEITVDGWDITDYRVNTGFNDYGTTFGYETEDGQQLSKYATFNIFIDMERNAWGLFMKLFIGMYIAFFISAISFIIDPSEVEPRFGLPVGGLLAAVGNKYIIDSILPETSSFTLVDSLHAITFFAIFFTFAINAISLVYYNKGKISMSKKINDRGAWGVMILFFLINIIMVGLAIWS